MPELVLKRTRGVPTAADFNALVDALRELGSVQVAGAASAMDLPTGRAWLFEEPPPHYAQIISGSNPYVWQRVVRNPAGAWIGVGIQGGVSGTCPAYEANGRTDVPAGKIVSLWPGNGCEMIFQDVRKGTSHSGCVTSICVAGCPSGAPLVGATVQIKSGSTVVATGTTLSPSGCVTLSIPAAGTYTVAITATGYQGWTGSQSLACNGTTYITLQPSTVPASLVFSVTGCCAIALPGASIVLSDGQSCTTDVNGQCSFWVGTGATYGYTVTSARYTTVTGSVTLTACPTSSSPIGVAMNPAPGYVCGPGVRQSDNTQFAPFPVPTTLYLTDSVYGSCTLTYDPTYQAWYGSLTATFNGACSCPTQPITIGYLLAGCGAPQPGFMASASVANYGVFITGTGCQGCASYNTSICPTNATPSAPDCTTLTSCGFYGTVTMPTPNGSGGLYGAVTGEFPTVFTSPGDSCPFTETIAGSAPFSLDINWPGYVPSGSTCPNCQPAYVAPTSLPWAAAGVTFTITE